mmetsp:Transcript_100232/g.198790  ORF Transcript_100232/g.198790 Transcript_100232/m.198790 type:complete len:118 (-) Transcript_100232:168-521(-)
MLRSQMMRCVGCRLRRAQRDSGMQRGSTQAAPLQTRPEAGAITATSQKIPMRRVLGAIVSHSLAVSSGTHPPTSSLTVVATKFLLRKASRTRARLEVVLCSCGWEALRAVAQQEFGA